jgi:hypothetical protein
MIRKKEDQMKIGVTLEVELDFSKINMADVMNILTKYFEPQKSEFIQNIEVKEFSVIAPEEE